MMTGLFVILSGAIASLYFKKRSLGVVIFLIGLVLCWLMLWYHATTPLQIRL